MPYKLKFFRQLLIHKYSIRGSKKAIKNVPAEGKKKVKFRRKKSFRTCTVVLKQVHPDTGTSSEAKRSREIETAVVARWVG